jgi:hypothetical protein
MFRDKQYLLRPHRELCQSRNVFTITGSSMGLVLWNGAGPVEMLGGERIEFQLRVLLPTFRAVDSNGAAIGGISLTGAATCLVADPNGDLLVSVNNGQIGSIHRVRASVVTIEVPDTGIRTDGIAVGPNRNRFIIGRPPTGSGALDLINPPTGAAARSAVVAAATLPPCC